ncbi:MAG: hypothetical protein V7K85_07605, partial [Nostoc sp.]
FSDSNLLSGWISYLRTGYRDLLINESHVLPKWYPPEFLPQGGKGILFLDELNMAPPAMQGVAQQFQAFIQLYKTLPNLTPILAGKGDRTDGVTKRLKR